MHLEASSHGLLVAKGLDVQRSRKDAQARELALAADIAADDMRIAQLHEEIAWLRAQEAQLQAGEVESSMPGLSETMTTDGGFEQWELLSHAEMLDLERRIAEVRASCDRLLQQELSEDRRGLPDGGSDRGVALDAWELRSRKRHLGSGKR